jgi:hypothetical protein
VNLPKNPIIKEITIINKKFKKKLSNKKLDEIRVIIKDKTIERKKLLSVVLTKLNKIEIPTPIMTKTSEK